MSLKEKGAERAKLERLLIAVLALGLFAAVAAYAVCFYGFKDNSYTQEAAYRIDCMCEKLGLSCLRGFNPAEDYGDLCRRAGIGDICRSADQNVQWDFDGGYLHDNGTFHMDGKVAWKGSLQCAADFRLVRTMKDASYSVVPDDGGREEYREWNYTTRNGQAVRLASSSTKAVIIAERKNSFIAVNVSGDFVSDTFGRCDKMLEEMAEMFDFSAIP